MKIFGQVLDIDGLPMGLANVTIVSGELADIMGDEADLDGNLDFCLALYSKLFGLCAQRQF